MTEIVFDGEIRGAWRGNIGKESTAGEPFFYCKFLGGTCGNFTAVRIIERRAILRQWRENDET